MTYALGPNYAEPHVIGMLVVSEGPGGRRGDIFAGKGGFGPVGVDFDFEVKDAGSRSSESL